MEPDARRREPADLDNLTDHRATPTTERRGYPRMSTGSRLSALPRVAPGLMLRVALGLMLSEYDSVTRLELGHSVNVFRDVGRLERK